MKSALALVATALVLTAFPAPSAADHAPSGIVFPIAETGTETLKQIEIKVAIQQYEKVLTATYEHELAMQTGPEQPFANAEEEKRWKDRVATKELVLRDMARRLQETILSKMPEAGPAKNTEKP